MFKFASIYNFKVDFDKCKTSTECEYFFYCRTDVVKLWRSIGKYIVPLILTLTSILEKFNGAIKTSK